MWPKPRLSGDLGRFLEDGLDRNQHVKSSNLFEKVPASTINNSTEGDGANGPIEANDITEQRED